MASTGRAPVELRRQPETPALPVQSAKDRTAPGRLSSLFLRLRAALKEGSGAVPHPPYAAEAVFMALEIPRNLSRINYL